MLSPVRLSVVDLSSVTFVRPTQQVEIFGSVSMPFGTLASIDNQAKFYRERPRGTPPSGPREWGLNARGVAKYSDFGPFEGYISETMLDVM